MGKLWLLQPQPELLAPYSTAPNPWEPWWDKAFGFVVRAETEHEARTFAAEDAGDEDCAPLGNPWLDPGLSTCVELPGNGAAGIVLRDFRSA